MIMIFNTINIHSQNQLFFWIIESFCSLDTKYGRPFNMENHCYQDSHVHFADPLMHSDIHNNITKARRQGILRFFTNTATEQEWLQTLQLGSAYPEVMPFLGIHPWYADAVSKDWQNTLRDHLDSSWCGVGEIGLDKKCASNPSQQEKLFCDQLLIACKFKRPVSIHCVGRWGKLLDILYRFSTDQQLPPTLIHSYSGSLEVMKKLIQIGCFLSFSKPALERPKIRTVLQKMPLTHLLLETDAPNQVHTPHSAYTPQNIIDLYAEVATLHDISRQQLLQQLWNNGSLFTTRSPLGQGKTS